MSKNISHFFNSGGKKFLAENSVQWPLYWSLYYSIFANTKTRRASAHTATSDLQRNAFKRF